jgi:hypothetical protein
VSRGVCASYTLALAIVGLSGCGGVVDTTYGRARSRSVNGTSIFAGLLRANGHEVRPAIRLTEELHDWAEVIVRFASRPGAPNADETAWYYMWMRDKPGRTVVYIPRDYDAFQEYWTRVADDLPTDAPLRLRTRVEEERAAAKGESHVSIQPPPHPTAPGDWFAVESASDAPRVCTTLSGPWAAGLDPVDVVLTRNQTIKNDGKWRQWPLLFGDDKRLIVERSNGEGSRILVIANGCFLLNVPITKRAREPLVQHVVEWIGTDFANRSRIVSKHVAFIEGSSVLTERSADSSVFALLRHDPFGWVIGQFSLLALAASLAAAPRLGRARPEPASGADRPVAHPEALGALLARAGHAREAKLTLDAYRRWRFGKTDVPAERSSTGESLRADRL